MTADKPGETSKKIKPSLEQAKRLKALLKALGLTQEQAADRGGLPNGRTQINRAVNKGIGFQSHPFRDALRKALWLTRDHLDAYLDGAATLEQTLARIQAPAMPPVADPLPAPVGTAFDTALLWALDKEVHDIRDLDAVREVLREVSAAGDVEMLVRNARVWLDLAADLRRKNEPVTLRTLFLALSKKSVIDSQS